MLIPLLSSLLIAAAPLSAAGGRRGGNDTEGFQRHLQLLEMQIASHDAEVAILNEKITSQQDAIEELQRRLKQADKSSSLQIQKDIDQLRDRSATQLQQQSQRLEKLEAYCKEQIGKMQVALNSLIDALKDEEVIYYQVKMGDSLSVIAQKHHTTVKAISNLNNLKNNTIFPGQKLRIPERKHE